MRKYDKIQRLKSLLSTLLGCAGWGILGWLLMGLEGWFWAGWIMLAVAITVGAWTVDRHLMPRRW